jgi:hypothetical protein
MLRNMPRVLPEEEIAPALRLEGLPALGGPARRFTRRMVGRWGSVPQTCGSNDVGPNGAEKEKGIMLIPWHKAYFST